MSFEIHAATRSAVKALVGFYGKSGGGKTMSALLFARGLVGPQGRIVMIDTENKRGSLFADLIPGGYSVLDITEPFSPERYMEAIEVAEKSADVVVVDSMSHEWAGEGGILDMQEAELTRMAGDNWQKREACKMAAWIRPKMAHKKFVQRLLRSPAHILCCLRGEEKTTMKKENGKTIVEKDDFSTCIADPRFIFEMLVNLEVFSKDGAGGFCHIRKITHTGTRACLPDENQQISIVHGEALAKWCAGTVAAPAPATKAESSVTALKKKLWTATKDIHGGDKFKLDEWLHDQKILGEAEHLDTLTADHLVFVVEKAEIALSEVPMP